MVAQSIVNQFCRSGRHRRRDRDGQDALRERRDALVAALERELPGGALRAARRAATSCGSSCPRASTSPSSRRPRRERDVLFVKGTDFLLEGGENTLRLAYSGRDAGADRRGHHAARRGGALARRRRLRRRASGTATGTTARSSASCSGPTATGRTRSPCVIHGGFWRARYGRKLMDALCARPRRARLGGVEHRVPPARRAAAAGRARSTTSPPAIDHLAELRARRWTSAGARRARSATRAGGHLRGGGGPRRQARRRRAARAGDRRGRPGGRARPARWRGELRLSDGVVRELLGGPPAERAGPLRVASPLERLPLGVPALLDARRPRRHRAARDVSERFADAARAAGDACELVVIAGRGPLRAPRPGEPAVEGGARVAGVTPRATPRRSTPPTRSRRSATRFVIADERPDLPRRQLARPAAGRPRATGCAALIDRVGRASSSRGWHDWIDAPTRAGDALGRACSAPRPGEVLVADSTTVNLYKLAVRGARRARPRRARHRPRQLPDRPLRARGHRRAARPRAAALRPPTRSTGRPPPTSRARRARSSCSRTSATARARWPTWRRSPRRARGRRDVIWDLCHSAGAVPVDLDARGRRARRRLHLQVPQRRARARPRSSTCAEELQERAALADLGLVRPARPVRDGARRTTRRRASRRFLAGTPPILGLAAVEEGARLTAEAGIDALRAKSRRADRADRSRCTTSGSRRSASSSARRATPRAAARTSRCATPRRGRSAAR